MVIIETARSVLCDRSGALRSLEEERNGARRLGPESYALRRPRLARYMIIFKLSAVPALPHDTRRVQPVRSERAIRPVPEDGRTLGHLYGLLPGGHPVWSAWRKRFYKSSKEEETSWAYTDGRL